MIWRRSLNSRIAQVADFITFLIGIKIAHLIWGYLYLNNFKQIPKPFAFNENVILLVVFMAFLSVWLFNYYGAYNYQRFTSLSTEYTVILKVSIVTILLAIAITFFMGAKNLPRTIFIISSLTLTLLYIIEKSILFFIAGYVREKGRNRKRVLVVGTGTRAKRFISVVNNNFKWGIDIIGLLTGDEEKVGSKFYGLPVVNTYNNIEDVLKEINPEEVIITISTKRFGAIRMLLDACEQAGVRVRLNSDFFGYLTKRVRVDNVLGLNIISFSFTKENDFDSLIKRLFDIIFSSSIILVLSPLYIIIAILIYLQDGFPILFNWKVVGYDRKPIKSWKFRTMVKNADEIKKKLMNENEMTGPVFKMTNDPRILPIGHFLRKYSLDELPQLFSVLKGDLSLVGPRPPLEYEFKEFELWQRRKLSVKPGLTCLWQVSGRNDISNFNDWVKLDLQYIDNWSLMLDFKILLKTIPVVLLGKGAK